MQQNLEFVKANVEGDGVSGGSSPKRPSSSQLLWRNLWKTALTLCQRCMDYEKILKGILSGMRSITKSGEKKNLWTCSRSEECVPLWWRGSCCRAGSQGCQHQIAGTSTAIINVKTKYLIPVQDINTYIPSLFYKYYPRTLTVSDRKKLSCLSSKLLSWE